MVGPGFTEWTNVTKARPNFVGHYQPRLPAELGFCDLRVPEVRAAPAQTVALWRDECRAAGLGELYVGAVQPEHGENAVTAGFDAMVEFPPLSQPATGTDNPIEVSDPDFAGHVHGYRGRVTGYLTRMRPPYPLLRGVMPSWDNTPRRQNDGSPFVESNPETFQFWVEETVRQTILWARGEERLVFVNAWNEWAEGCYLEPDRRYGRAVPRSVAERTRIRAGAAPTAPDLRRNANGTGHRAGFAVRPHRPARAPGPRGAGRAVGVGRDAGLQP